MSTELRNVPGTKILQTRFAGGKGKGSCLQLTVSDRGSFQRVPKPSTGTYSVCKWQRTNRY